MISLRNTGIKISLLFIIASLIFAFSLGASGCEKDTIEAEDIIEEPAEEPAEEPPAEPDAEIVEAEEIAEEEVGDTETGLCYNPYFPVEEDKVWNYTIESTGVDPFSYSVSFTDIDEGSFKQVVVLPDATINTEWTCSDEGILENDFRQLDVDDSETGQVAIFETISAEGITFPAVDLLAEGYTWSILYDLEGTISTPDSETEADVKVVMDFEVIGFEDIVVPAGNYQDALKIAQNSSITITTDFFENTVVADSISWYAKNIGWVKNEGSLDDIQTITVLDSIE
jgi:hypothetical protein